MVEVAARAGVSAVTVSRVLRTPEIVADDTRARVETAVREMGYTPNLVARSLAGSRSGMIAIIIPTVTSPYYGDILRALEAEMREARTDVLIGCSDFDIATEDRLVNALLARQSDAIVLVGNQHAEGARTMLKSVRVPVVEISGLPDEPIDMAVGFSNRAAGRAVTAHLVERGAKRVANLHAEVGAHNRLTERRAGYEEAVKKAGRKAGSPIVVDCEHSHAGGAAGMAEVLAKHPDVDGVFGANDTIALGALFECQRRGIAVPGKIRVAGCDDLPETAVVHPRLTTLRIDRVRIGTEAGKLIRTRFAGDRPAQPVVDIGFELVQRETT
jgi:LacI family gluconate utilization system Gnt-I transcriptional repressor